MGGWGVVKGRLGGGQMMFLNYTLRNVLTYFRRAPPALYNEDRHSISLSMMGI
jgi:hypothetical protein